MNYYEILKLQKNATETQIKSAYKKLVKQYHPDLYVGDKDFAEKKIKEINEAYDILSNPKTKLEYDEYLASLMQQQPQPTPTQTTYQNQTSATENQPSYTGSMFSQFIIKKINKLNKKHQLQLFIIFFMIILVFFLVNLIELKNFLDNPKKIPQNNTTINNSIDNSQNKTTSNSTPTNKINEFDEINNMIYELFKQYENVYNSNSTLNNITQ